MRPVVSEIHWLRHDSRRFATVDSDRFSVFELDKTYRIGSSYFTRTRKKRGYAKVVPFTRQYYILFKQKHGVPRLVSQGHFDESIVAVAFSDCMFFHRSPREVDQHQLRRGGPNLFGLPLDLPPVSMSWNYVDKGKLLVVGHGKRTGDTSSLTVLDLEHQVSLGIRNIRTSFRWITHDTLSSAAFFPEDKDIIALVGNRKLRVFDLRGNDQGIMLDVSLPDGSQLRSIQVEPLLGHRFLTYSSDIYAPSSSLLIYDRRYLKKPLYTISDYNKERCGVKQCCWSPHNRFAINCLLDDSDRLFTFTVAETGYSYPDFEITNNYNAKIERMFSDNAESFPYMTESFSFPNVHNIRSFQWHPTYKNEVAIVTNTPKKDFSHIQLCSINPFVCASLGVNNEFLYTFNQFGSVTETVMERPIAGQIINFLEAQRPPNYKKVVIEDADIMPKHYAELLEHKKLNALCERVFGKVNIAREMLTPQIEQEFFKKHWKEIFENAQSDMKRILPKLSPVLLFTVPESSSKRPKADISVVMRMRAEVGFGYGNIRDDKNSLVNNCLSIVENHTQFFSMECHWAWRWIYRLRELQENDLLKVSPGYPFVGVNYILAKTISKSSQYDEYCRWGSTRVFTNNHRNVLLQMWHWPRLGDSDGIKLLCDFFMREKTVENFLRAVFIAMSACQSSMAIKILKKLRDAVFSKKTSFRLQYKRKHIETYNDLLLGVITEVLRFDGVSMTKETYESNIKKLGNEFELVAIIKLLSKRLNYSTIMWEIAMTKKIAMEDRALFCLIHMDDAMLTRVFKVYYEELLLYTPLKALIFTGLYDNRHSYRCLERYYENTHDLQTCSILYVIGNCFRTFSVFRDPHNLGIITEDLIRKVANAIDINKQRKRAMHCFFDYMELLSAWDMDLERLFIYNQLFDHLKRKSKKSHRAQAVIACNYCGRPAYPCVIDKFKPMRFDGRREMADNYQSRGRITTCAYCRKPLPKCSVCRMHYGSIIESINGQNESASVFDQSFVFCSHCHHGGHYKHMHDWFHLYDICPSSGCRCMCMRLDGSLIDQAVLIKSRRDGSVDCGEKHTHFEARETSINKLVKKKTK